MALFILFSLCNLSRHIWSKNQGRSPEPGHSYWMKTDQETMDFIIVLLSMCFYPKRGAKRHISSKASVAEPCISNGRQAIYRAAVGRISTETHCRVNNQYSRSVRVGVLRGASGSLVDKVGYRGGKKPFKKGFRRPGKRKRRCGHPHLCFWWKSVQKSG